MPDNSNKTFSALSLAWELGYMIAVPIILLTLLGRLGDRFFGTSPWLLLSGIVLSTAITTVLVYKKTKEIM